MKIMTDRGWQPLGGELGPVPPPARFGHFPGSASFDALFIGSDGRNMRETGNWYRQPVPNLGSGNDWLGKAVGREVDL